MNHQQTIKTWIKNDEERMAVLYAAKELDLQDWCLAAGFVRNLIWDKIHHFSTTTPLNDMDLIYFDTSNSNEEQDILLESKLKEMSNHPWSVKNQARMHQRNNDHPYLSTSDAMTYWVELETAIGVSLTEDNELVIKAPFGLSYSFENTITMNPKRPKPDAFLHRVISKKWQTIWPNLKTVP